jgi:hypothetical protein
MNGSAPFRTVNGGGIAHVGTGITGRRTSDGRGIARGSGGGAKGTTGGTIIAGTAVVTEAGITETAADNGSVGQETLFSNLAAGRGTSPSGRSVLTAYVVADPFTPF